jgi:peptidoglycan hydrolase FlgJ
MTAPLNTTANLALDTQNLAQLRLQAKQSPDQALKGAAQQFESLFLNMMLKSMREATPQDGMFDSEQTRMFTGMLDQQLAQNMASRGVGLAEIMMKQLSHTMAGQAGSGIQTPAALPSAYKNPHDKTL